MIENLKIRMKMKMKMTYVSFMKYKLTWIKLFLKIIFFQRKTKIKNKMKGLYILMIFLIAVSLISGQKPAGNIIKPGSCPRYEVMVASCKTECYNDSNCSGNRKCVIYNFFFK